MSERAVFGRVGWMTFYNGPQPGDPRPRGGGAYNVKQIGGEVDNFKVIGGKVYGFFMVPMTAETLDLSRIDPSCTKDHLDRVLVVLFATSPERGQVVVGWYRNATVFESYENRPHLRGRESSYNCVTSVKNAVLVPTDRRVKVVPRGKGATGQSNVFYVYDTRGRRRNAPWIKGILDYVESYGGPNLLSDPLGEAQGRVIAATERTLSEHAGQGIGGTPAERRAVEDRAMRAAIAYFRGRGFHVEDVSATRPYDLLCKKRLSELHVEVKGTQAKGDQVFLSKNEVEHVKKQPGKSALFVLHGIRVGGRKASPSASGGTMIVEYPWRIRKNRLTPYTYVYRTRQNV